MQKIIPPTNCPSCNSKLVWKKDVLYCTSSNCTVKMQKAIEHWGKTLKIKGLGPKTIEKLAINSIVDLYDLSEDTISEALGSKKLASTLYAEIQKSKLASLNMALPAFNIPLIGNSATKKLCSVINHINELSFEKAKEAGLGPKATENLMYWFYTKYEPELSVSLPLDLKTEEDNINEVVKKCLGVICITGKLKSFKTKAEAEKILTQAGYIVKSSVTKDVTIIINESGIESAKTKKAREAGLEIVSNLNLLLGE